MTDYALPTSMPNSGRNAHFPYLAEAQQLIDSDGVWFRGIEGYPAKNVRRVRIPGITLEWGITEKDKFFIRPIRVKKGDAILHDIENAFGIATERTVIPQVDKHLEPYDGAHRLPISETAHPLTNASELIVTEKDTGPYLRTTRKYKSWLCAEEREVLMPDGKVVTLTPGDELVATYSRNPLECNVLHMIGGLYLGAPLSTRIDHDGKDIGAPIMYPPHTIYAPYTREQALSILQKNLSECTRRGFAGDAHAKDIKKRISLLKQGVKLAKFVPVR